MVEDRVSFVGTELKTVAAVVEEQRRTQFVVGHFEEQNRREMVGLTEEQSYSEVVGFVVDCSQMDAV